MMSAERNAEEEPSHAEGNSRVGRAASPTPSLVQILTAPAKQGRDW